MILSIVAGVFALMAVSIGPFTTANTIMTEGERDSSTDSDDDVPGEIDNV